MQFSVQKEIRLKKEDLSRKGSIDTKIVDLINYINDQDCYASTSSCSGRTSVFTNSIVCNPRLILEVKKKGLNWIFISHEIVNPESVITALKEHTGTAILKFEPFVLHVQCASLEDAQRLHSVALESGFKNSGLTIGKKGRIIAAVRSPISLETPLSSNGVSLVSNEFIHHVVDSCNKKMEENWLRIERFHSKLKTAVEESKNSNKEKRKSSKMCGTHQENAKIHVKQESSIDSFFDCVEDMLFQENT